MISPPMGGGIHLELVGPPGRRLVIQATDTVGQTNWTSLFTNVAGGGVLKFDDLNAPDQCCRFYRAQVVP
jgi:hypothetical protein